MVSLSAGNTCLFTNFVAAEAGAQAGWLSPYVGAGGATIISMPVGGTGIGDILIGSDEMLGDLSKTACGLDAFLVNPSGKHLLDTSGVVDIPQAASLFNASVRPDSGPGEIEAENLLLPRAMR